MLKRTYLPLAVIAPVFALGVAQSASARESDSPWSTTLTAGANLLPHSTFLHSRNATVGPGNVSLDSLTFDDLFNPDPSFGLELGYQLTSDLESFVRFDYSQMSGTNALLGRVTTAGGVSAIRGDFDDLKTYSLDVGTRFYFHDGNKVRPYLTGYLGVDRGDAVYGHFSVGGATLGRRRETVLPQETRFDAGVEAGIDYRFESQWSVRLSVGADYSSSRHEETRAFETLGLGPIRVSDQTWSIPIDLGLSVKF
ncbi:MAG: outer membrane beta-barrel protein [Steroidobacteraceae bacterium]